jgi:hypothetical protein
MKSDDLKYPATFSVLGEYMKHHVKEEESKILPNKLADGAQDPARRLSRA